MKIRFNSSKVHRFEALNSNFSLEITHFSSLVSLTNFPRLFQFTGSQESILQLDMDIDDAEYSDNYNRRDSVSPLPQIRPNVRNSTVSLDSDSDNVNIEVAPVEQEAAEKSLRVKKNRRSLPDNYSFNLGINSLPATLRNFNELEKCSRSTSTSSHPQHSFQGLPANLPSNSKVKIRPPLTNILVQSSIHCCDNNLGNDTDFVSSSPSASCADSHTALCDSKNDDDLDEKLNV